MVVLNSIKVAEAKFSDMFPIANKIKIDSTNIDKDFLYFWLVW